ncbi:hypothetical protein [Naasia sp. SYSU D00057]|uniref:hypothetical protein n=1 Tax=Naasia sp. SYSU D00057 TaxID=2817380 RepID=UPI0027DD5534|nr:hypothetical protein [Naasia sp. SYSU D00057]
MTDAADLPLSAPAGGVVHRPRFFVKQRVTMLVNRYEIREARPDGGEGAVLAIAEQKRLALKERVTFFADEARSTPIFSLRARQALDVAAAYDVFDAEGHRIGWFRKDFGASLLRSSFHLGAPGLEAYGQERSLPVAIVRRFLDIALPLHFDFTDTTTGAPVLSSERQMTLRDRYTVDVPDPRVDFRLAAAMAVGLYALMQR